MTMLSTKDKIFQSALELFASQGIQATSTAQISKKAGSCLWNAFCSLQIKANEIWTYNSFMRFALSNNERIEPTKGAKGLCPSCGSELVAKSLIS